jgi:bifunctional non-homologous end joining protein LigD
MLATLGQLPAKEDGWAFEFKWDGHRAVCYVDSGGEARFVSRRNKDHTDDYRELQPLGLDGTGSLPAPLAAQLPAVFDGEIVAFDESGVPRFQALQARGQNPTTPIAYIVFDLLCLAGRSLLDEAYVERRRLLEELELDELAYWMVSPSFEGGGQAILEASVQRGLEGVMAKKLDSRYLPGRRSPVWIKVKNTLEDTFVVGGYTTGEGWRANTIGALLLGSDDEGGLRYVGKVGSGFGERELADLERLTAQIITEDCPFTTAVPAQELRNATWVRPVLRGKVKYTEWTSARRLRAPVWLGLTR